MILHERGRIEYRGFAGEGRLTLLKSFFNRFAKGFTLEIEPT